VCVVMEANKRDRFFSICPFCYYILVIVTTI
jgi:hypothetical protein